jgi:YVTN family beta-propeller protein
MDSRFLTAQLRAAAHATAACALLAAVVGLPHAASAQAAPSGGLINPRAIAFSPATGKVYAVDTSHGSVQIYDDAARQSRRVPVGPEPVSVAVNTANGTAYVANAGNGTVSVIDAHTDAVVATVPIGGRPYSIAADATTGKVYATHTFDDKLTVLDGATNTVTNLKTGGEDLIAINAKTGAIYLLGYGGEIKVLDTATQKITHRDVGRHAWALTLDDATGTVYVTRIEDADLAAVTNDSSAPTILPAGAIPCAIAVNSKANKLYVANNGDNSVAVIDVATRRKTATIPAGDHPKAVAFDPVRNLIYVANTLSNTVTIIDAASNAVLATLPAGKSPYALAVVPGSGSLYVANESDSASTVVDLAGVHAPHP